MQKVKTFFVSLAMATGFIANALAIAYYIQVIPELW